MALINLTNRIDIQTAQRRGFDTFDIVLGGWSRDVFDRFPFKGEQSLPLSVFGIMIGPNSEMDRAWVTWNPLGDVSDDSLPYVHPLSVDSPLLFSQLAGGGGAETSGQNGVTTAMALSKLFVFPNGSDGGGVAPDMQASTILPANFAPYTATDAATIPLITNIARGTSDGWTDSIAPVMHLRFLLNLPAMQLPTKRMPRSYAGTVQTAGGNELMTIIPTMGRKNVVVNVSCEAAATFRVGALRNANRLVPVIEALEGEKTVAGTNTATTFKFCDPCADYITLWCEAVAGQAFRYRVTVSD